MYTVSIGTEVQEFEQRAEAIAKAKAVSAETRQTVVVLDESQRERMTYQYGELESYTFETRHGRRATAQVDEEEDDVDLDNDDDDN
ncbi:MAG: hypothetical protein KC635_20075 [Myxococcales bacterium]|nr:hypothetical protein [Myxococcales bacterium]MCB9736585.1 hypothetical protein [Deltaproteobacteria bacterium]